VKRVDELCINTLRFLAVEAVETARSGHPGLPLGAAPMAYVLWDRYLQHNGRNPSWFNRDRFILSAGHGSALLYALLHLYGYDLSLDDVKRFRQWESKTPGHPEHGVTPGVEATTGPLGQGVAMGVGMAMAERFLAECFNRPSLPLMDHYTYAIVSDGDLMEGISSEAASLAGHLQLGKLIYLYDDNHISIEGDTAITFTEDVQKRFEAFHWNVLRVSDGNDLDAIDAAIAQGRAEASKPTLIMVRTHIGYGSPKQDSADAHGAPLGTDALAATKANLDWPPEPAFHIPEDAARHFRAAGERGATQETEWQALLERYRREEPDLAAQFDRVVRGELPDGWDRRLPRFDPAGSAVATRNASGAVLNALNDALHTLGSVPDHSLLGGSGDLAPSNRSILKGYRDFGSAEACAHNIHYGVREHAMGAITNGMALHGGVLPYAATFLVFSDYMRPAIRMAALMQTHVVFLFTHDSIMVGEDGPTHQPVEHVMGLRIIPHLTVLRPADANETAAAWGVAVARKRPTALILTRQSLPVLDPEQARDGTPKGAYVLADAASGAPDLVLLATGSEVHLALATRDALLRQDVRARVVSMPSWELFEEQPDAYKRRVLPPDLPKLALEAGVTTGWHRYLQPRGDALGIDRFGASAPGTVVYDQLGFNVETVVNRALALVR
jgi:transketolase